MNGMTRYGHNAVRRSRDAPAARRRPEALRGSAAIDSHELRVAERLRAHVETDERGRSVCGQLEFRHLERIEPEVIVVRLTRRRARAAVTGGAEVGASLHRTGGQEALLRIAGAGGK